MKDFFDVYKLNPDLKYRIIKYTQNREFAMLCPKGFPNPEANRRNLRVHNTHHFDFVLDFCSNRFNPEDFRQFNLYYSLARYKEGIPFSKIVGEERRTIMDAWAETGHKKNIVAYDFLIDIDAPSHESKDLTKAWKQAHKLFLWLNDCKVPFYCHFSGCGFHFIIPYSELPKSLSLNPEVYNGLYRYLEAIALALCKVHKLDLIDTQIYDSRRIVKVPYSLAFYKEFDRPLMCLPMFEFDFWGEVFDVSKFIYGIANYRNRLDVFNNEEHAGLFHFNNFVNEVLINGKKKTKSESGKGKKSSR